MTIQDKIKVFRLATQTIYMLLVGSIAINLLIQKAPIVIFVLSLMPLLIFVQGIIKNKIKTLIWLSFVLLLYFTISIYKLSIPQSKVIRYDRANPMCELIYLCLSERKSQTKTWNRMKIIGKG